MAAAAARRPWGERAKRAIVVISDMSGPPVSSGRASHSSLPGSGTDKRAPNLDTTVSGFATLAPRMDALTIHEAAETTGWSPRMLRYVERVGLVEPARSASG